MSDQQPAASEDSEPSRVAGDTVLQTGVLENLSEAVNYRRWLSRLALPWLGDDPLEIGAGTGDYAAEWAAAGFSVTASEADPGRLAHLRRRFAGDPNVRVRDLSVPLTEEASHSAVVAYNVLEHIAEDVEALHAVARLLRPGGRAVLLVPAFPMAMSRFDRQIGHFRRYRRAEVERKLRQAGFQVQECRYVNPVGLVAWFVVMRLLGQHPRPGIPLLVYDRLLVPLLARLDRRWRPPFGQSVFAVAVKPDNR